MQGTCLFCGLLSGRQFGKIWPMAELSCFSWLTESAQACPMQSFCKQVPYVATSCDNTYDVYSALMQKQEGPCILLKVVQCVHYKLGSIKPLSL